MDEQPRITLRQLLNVMIQRGSSDLHVTTGTPPQLRIDGSLVPLRTPPLGPVESKALCYEVMTEEQKVKFERHNELDFSFGVKGLSRFRANVFMQRGAVAGAFRDVANVTSLGVAAGEYNLTVNETADIIGPVMSGAQLNLSDGVLSIFAFETMDATPSDFVNVSLMYLNNRTGHDYLNLVGATVTAFDDIVVHFTLTERQRSSAVLISGTPGGDGDPAVLHVLPGGVRDVAGNPSLDHGREDVSELTVVGLDWIYPALRVQEIEDTVPPLLVSVRVDYSTGAVRFVHSETPKIRPMTGHKQSFLDGYESFNFTKVRFADATAFPNASSVLLASIHPDTNR